MWMVICQQVLEVDGIREIPVESKDTYGVVVACEGIGIKIAKGCEIY